jgi:hypothetical protein
MSVKIARSSARVLVWPEGSPDHSTISRTRRLIDLETHEAVFTWMLQRLGDAGLVKGKTVGIDATTLEANAALSPPRSIDSACAGQLAKPAIADCREPERWSAERKRVVAQCFLMQVSGSSR